MGTDALSVNSIPALISERGICTCARIKGACGFDDLAIVSVLKRVENGVQFSVVKRPKLLSESQILRTGQSSALTHSGAG